MDYSIAPSRETTIHIYFELIVGNIEADISESTFI
jgi:hypothetical protein